MIDLTKSNIKCWQRYSYKKIEVDLNSTQVPKCQMMYLWSVVSVLIKDKPTKLSNYDSYQSVFVCI